MLYCLIIDAYKDMMMLKKKKSQMLRPISLAALEWGGAHAGTSWVVFQPPVCLVLSSPLRKGLPYVHIVCISCMVWCDTCALLSISYKGFEVAPHHVDNFCT